MCATDRQVLFHLFEMHLRLIKIVLFLLKLPLTFQATIGFEVFLM
jgi:hypothetical protein